MVLWQPRAAGMHVSSPETGERRQGVKVCDKVPPCLGHYSGSAWVRLQPPTPLLLGLHARRRTYMRRLPGADMDLSSLLLGHSKGLLKERFLSMALTKI